LSFNIPCFGEKLQAHTELGAIVGHEDDVG
jgi:hypothetical protein